MRGSPDALGAFELRILGPPRIRSAGGQDIDLARQPKRVALLAYLAATTLRGPQRRDRLLALFWPESDAPHARAALSQALYVLRSRLGDAAIRSHGDDELALDTSVVWCDCVAFEQHLDAGRPADALALYEADLLDSFFVSDTPAFDEWLESERYRLRLRAADGAWQLAAAAAAGSRTLEAARWARRASDMVPTDEAVARRLIAFLDKLGDRAAAIRAYEAFAWRLAHEFELEPSAETRALAARIRDAGQPTTVRPIAVQPSTVPSMGAPAPVVAGAPTPALKNAAAPAPVRRHTRHARYAALIAVVSIAGGLYWGFARADEQPSPQPMHVFLNLPSAPPVGAALRGSTVAVSPGGDRLAYVGTGEHGRQIYLRAMDRADAIPVSDTRGASLPFFSANGEWLAFTRGDTLRKLRLPDGTSAIVCVAASPMFGASWGPRDVIVFATAEGLWRVGANEGAPQRLGERPRAGQLYRWPEVLPGGNAALFTVVDSSDYQLAAIDLDDGAIHMLGIEGSNPRFVEPGHLVFVDLKSSVFTAPFDPVALRVTGPSRLVADGVFVGGGGGAKLGLSRSGMIAYQPSATNQTLALLDRSGRAEILPLASSAFTGVRFSPDGRHLALTMRSREVTQHDIWMYDLEHKSLRRLTTDSGAVMPLWMPDGKRLVFASNVGGREAGWALRSLSLDIREPTAELYPRAVGQLPSAITPDGRSLLFSRTHPTRKRDIWILDLDASRSAKPYLDTPADEYMATASPDGRLVAFVSDASGRDDVYVTAFPSPGSPVRISLDGGSEPRWASARELMYRSLNGIVAVTIDDSPTAAITGQQLLFDASPYVAGTFGASYDVHPSGERFVMIRRGATPESIVLVLNWFEQLRRERD